MPVKKTSRKTKRKATRKTAKSTAKKSVKRGKKIRRKVYLTFPRDKTKQAIICDMYDRYGVRFNIRSASVDDQMGLIALEMEADSYAVMVKAFKYFERRGVKVEPIEMNVIEA
jgi:ABC-type methionine transport system ATPase subunit